MPETTRVFLKLLGRGSVELRKPRCYRRTAKGPCARIYGHPGPCEVYGVRRVWRA